MKKNFSLQVFLLILGCITLNAQFIKEKSIAAQIGIGLTSPYNSTEDVLHSGLFYPRGIRDESDFLVGTLTLCWVH